MKVYNSDTLIAERKERAAKIDQVIAYCGSRKANLEDTSGSLARKSPKFENVGDNLAEMEILRRRIINSYKSTKDIEEALLRNAASAPATADIEAFFGRYFLEVTRRVNEAADLTSLIALERVDPNFDKLLYKKDLQKYRGLMGRISGENDKPNMIQQATGNLATLGLYIAGLGWKDSIGNQLWNKFFTIDQVIQAAVDAYTDYRNAMIIGAISYASANAIFVAGQKQAAAETETNFTFDQKVYSRIRAGVKKLRGLYDAQTNRPIAVSSIRWLGNSTDTYDVENVIRGQLNGNGSSARLQNMPSLPISMMLEYDRGINDGYVIGKKTASFPGVAAGKGYLFVPDVALVAKKRALTSESGQGSVLDFATEERAWYGVQGEDLGDLLGSSGVTATLNDDGSVSYTAAPTVGTDGTKTFGAIVEVTLPTMT